MAKPKSSKKNQASKEVASAVPPALDAAALQAEVTRTEAVPISNHRMTESISKLTPFGVEEEIRQLAYLFSERRGFEPGHETEDWLAAEHEVLERHQQARAHHAGA